MTVPVSLLDWFQLGQFGPITLGMTRQELRDTLGAPEAVGGVSRRQPVPTIWRYGDIEFHFADDRLWLIYFDHFDIPTGGAALRIDPWVIRGGLPRTEAEKHLVAQSLAYRVIAWPDPDMVGLALSNGSTLGFVERSDEYSPPVGLQVVSQSQVTYSDRAREEAAAPR